MKFKVNIIESERGWGQRVDEVKIFDSKDYKNDANLALKAAKQYVKKFNSSNNEATVPDWYMYASEPQLV